GIDHDIDESVVLRRSAHHRRAADIDVFNGIVERAIRFCHGLLERIQVDDHHVDRRDAVLSHHRIVLTAAAENAAVDFRVQRFYTAIHHFWKTGVLGYFDDGDAAVLEQFVGAAGGEQLDAEVA